MVIPTRQFDRRLGDHRFINAGSVGLRTRAARAPTGRSAHQPQPEGHPELSGTAQVDESRSTAGQDAAWVAKYAAEWLCAARRPARRSRARWGSCAASRSPPCTRLLTPVRPSSETDTRHTSNGTLSAVPKPVPKPAGYEGVMSERSGTIASMSEPVGYARIFTGEQTSISRFDALKHTGCTRIFQDVASGSLKHRPELDRALDYVRTGDVLVV